MPLIFSYGTLQDTSVQREIFGRVVECQPDRLMGHTRVAVTLTDPGLIAASGGALLSNLEPTSGNDLPVVGTCLNVTDSELAQCDRYEQRSAYRRKLVGLESGRQAWVYTYSGVEEQ